MQRRIRLASTGTRGEILWLLCGSNHTAGELARALGISSNAAREHLQRLEDEGLVRYETVRRGVGKPAHEYRLTPDGERVLSRAYVSLVLQFLDTLEARLDEEALLGVLSEVGRGLAAQAAPARGNARRRAEAASEFLRELGGAGRVEERDGSLWIVSGCCPIGAVASRHPVACKVVEALVAEMVGARVRESCERSGRLRCRLQIDPAVESRGV